MKVLGILLILGVFAYQANAETQTGPNETETYLLNLYKVQYTPENYKEKVMCVQEAQLIKQDIDLSKGDYGEFTEQSFRLQEKLMLKLKRCKTN